MLKTVTKYVFVFTLTAAISACAASAAYIVTRNIIEKNEAASAQEQSIKSNYFPKEISEDQNVKSSSQIDYYVVKLEGQCLDVYSSKSGQEEFLYSKDIYRSNLSETDIKLLNKGVKLNSAAELTGFIEDYTS
jgi:Na+-translocating ferredoxin:NAD+ oxidoreductase RnfG subunit